MCDGLIQCGILLAQGKGHRKDELHQWDELKRNQRVQLEDLLEQHWNRGNTFPQPVNGYSLAGDDKSGEAVLLPPHWAHNSTRLTGTKDQTGTLENRESKGGRIPDDNKTVSSSVDNIATEVKTALEGGGTGQLLNRNEEEATEKISPSLQEDKKLSKGHTDGSSHPVTKDPQASVGHTEAGGSWLKPTKEPNPDPRGGVRQRDNETPEEERVKQEEEEDKVEREREELLLLHKKLDQEKEILRQNQLNREEEERQKGQNTDSRLQSKHHHPQTTQAPGKRNYWLNEKKVEMPMKKLIDHLTPTATTRTTTRQPSLPAGPRPPAHPKKKMRRNRKRMSKAAMRAMLM